MKLKLNGYTNMKRQLALEYRLYKLEKLFNEDSFDDELDTMSDDIVKNNPNIDIDDELNKKVSDIIKNNKDFRNTNSHGNKYEFDTIDEWIDHITFMTDLNEFPEFYYNGDVIKKLKGYIDTLSILNKGGATGLSQAYHLRRCIKELDGMNILNVQQKLVSTLRKRIAEIKRGY